MKSRENSVKTIALILSAAMLSACGRTEEQTAQETTTSISATEVSRGGIIISDQEPLNAVTIAESESEPEPEIYEEKIEEIVPDLEEEEISELDYEFREFEWEYAKALIENTDSNMLCSPFGMRMMLSMLYEGASEESDIYEDLKEILGYTDDGEYLNFLRDMLDTEEVLSLNSIWVDKGSFTLDSDYEKTLERDYSVQTFIYDLQSEDVASEYNKYIYQASEGSMQTLKDSAYTEDEIFVLENVMTLNNEWLLKFEQSSNYAGDFNGIETTFMYMQGLEQSYCKIGNLESISLYYKNPEAETITDQGLKMNLIHAVDGYDTLEEWLNTDSENQLTLATYNNSSISQYIEQDKKMNLSLPVFSLSSAIDAEDVLSQLGLDEIYTDETGCYENISKKAVVSSINQNVSFTCGNQGAIESEEVEIMLQNIPESTEGYDFIVDNSFIFVVSDNSGNIYFMGYIQTLK